MSDFILKLTNFKTTYVLSINEDNMREANQDLTYFYRYFQKVQEYKKKIFQPLRLNSKWQETKVSRYSSIHIIES